MPKPPPMTARQVEAILARAGFVVNRRTDHRIRRKGELTGAATIEGGHDAPRAHLAAEKPAAAA